MKRLQQCALCCCTVLVMIAGGAHGAAAAGVVLKNEMEMDIKAVYCVDNEGKAKEVVGALAAEISVTVSPDKFPEYECERIAVFVDEDAGWQFYQEPEPGAASEILFAMDTIGPKSEEVPTLLIETNGDTYVSMAGIPFSLLIQHIQFGLGEAELRKIVTPRIDPQENTAFFVSFADLSWSLNGEEIVTAELAPGKQYVTEVHLAAPFGNPNILAVFEGLKSARAAPLLFSHTAAGKERILKEAASAEERWDALMEQMQNLEGDKGGAVNILLSNEYIRIGLALDLDEAVAALVIERKKDVPLG